MNILLHHLLKYVVQYGQLRVTDSGGRVTTYKGKYPGKQAGLILKTKAAERALIFNPALSFGEKYMSGELAAEGDNLEALLEVLLFNIDHDTLLSDRILRPIGAFFQKLTPARLLRKTKWFQRNIAHHYDLSAHFYQLFLDKDMQYSCAYFRKGTETLEEAQHAKKRHIAEKLYLNRKNLHILDIGCGWGGLALTLARDYGAFVTAITLSQQQYEVTCKRVLQAGLSERIEVKFCDYRSLTGQFDRIVSVGMIEHVGKENYDMFFAKIRNLLKPDGVALIHSIGRKNGPSSTNPWILRYIFPGGYSPALSEIFKSVEKSKLWVTDCEILRLHYAKTLAKWRERFEANGIEIRQIYGLKFVRMFRFYLVSAEMAFRAQDHMNFQLQLTRELETLPLTRDYLLETRNISEKG